MAHRLVAVVGGGLLVAVVAVVVAVMYEHMILTRSGTIFSSCFFRFLCFYCFIFVRRM